VSAFAAGARHRARLDGVTGKSCRSDASGCPESVRVTTHARKARQQCMHWIRVRGCTRSGPRQHRLTAVAMPAASWRGPAERTPVSMQ
jgi:hypothetical protein